MHFSINTYRCQENVISINDESRFAQSREYGQRVYIECNKALADCPHCQELSKEQIYDVAGMNRFRLPGSYLFIFLKFAC